MISVTTHSLEGCGSTIELYPQIKSLAPARRVAFTARLQRQSTGPETVADSIREATDLIHVIYARSPRFGG